MSHVHEGPLATYNSLLDPHLTGYFSNTHIRKHLKKAKLVTRRGQVVSENHYRLINARAEHRKQVREMLAQAIVHKSLDLERQRQARIRMKLEEISKIELVKRVKAGRRFGYEETILDLLRPKNQRAGSTGSLPQLTQRDSDSLTLPQRSLSAKAKSQSMDGGNFLKGTTHDSDGRRSARLRDGSTRSWSGSRRGNSPRNHGSDTSSLCSDSLSSESVREGRHTTLGRREERIDDRNLVALDPNAFQQYDSGGADGGPTSSPYKGSLLTPHPPSSKSSKKLPRDVHGRPIKMAKHPKGRVNLHRQEPAFKHEKDVQTFCEVTLRYLGGKMNPELTQEVIVEQQHCGGSTLVVFKEHVKRQSNFTFTSKRHIGFPFGLTLYINGTQDATVSTCCEYKHTAGCKLGGKSSHFVLVKVTGAKPCYKCELEAEITAQKKSENAVKEAKKVDEDKVTEQDYDEMFEDDGDGKKLEDHSSSDEYDSDFDEDEKGKDETAAIPEEETPREQETLREVKSFEDELEQKVQVQRSHSSRSGKSSSADRIVDVPVEDSDDETRSKKIVEHYLQSMDRDSPYGSDIRKSNNVPVSPHDPKSETESQSARSEKSSQYSRSEKSVQSVKSGNSAKSVKSIPSETSSSTVKSSGSKQSASVKSNSQRALVGIAPTKAVRTPVGDSPRSDRDKGSAKSSVSSAAASKKSSQSKRSVASNASKTSGQSRNASTSSLSKQSSHSRTADNAPTTLAATSPAAGVQQKSAIESPRSSRSPSPPISVKSDHSARSAGSLNSEHSGKSDQTIQSDKSNHSKKSTQSNQSHQSRKSVESEQSKKSNGSKQSKTSNDSKQSETSNDSKDSVSSKSSKRSHDSAGSSSSSSTLKSSESQKPVDPKAIEKDSGLAAPDVDGESNHSIKDGASSPEVEPTAAASDSERLKQHSNVISIQRSGLSALDLEDVCDELSRRPELKSLTLTESVLEPAGMQRMHSALLRSGASLEELVLDKNNISRAAVPYIEEILKSQLSLQRLSLAENPIGDGGCASVIRTIMGLDTQCLKDLNLSRCYLAKDTAMELQSLITSSNITKLALSDNRDISDEFWRNLLLLLSHPQCRITHLDLSKNFFGKKPSILSCMKGARLVELNLSYSMLNDERVDTLIQQLPFGDLQVENLILEPGNAASEEKMALLRAHFKCESAAQVQTNQDDDDGGTSEMSDPNSSDEESSNDSSEDKSKHSQRSRQREEHEDSDDDEDDFGDITTSVTENEPIKRIVNGKTQINLSGLNQKQVSELVGLLTKRTDIRSLKLANSDVGDSGLEMLVGSLKPSENALKTLRLERTGITGKGCPHLIILLDHIPNIVELSLAGNKIGDAGAASLIASFLTRAHNSFNKKLDKYAQNLARNSLKGALDSPSLASLVSVGSEADSVSIQSMRLPELQVLDLSSCDIENSTMEKLVPLLQLNILRELSLADNPKPSQFRWKELIQMVSVNNDSLTHLNVAGNHLGKYGAMTGSPLLALAGVNLSELNISGSALSNETADRMISALREKQTAVSHVILERGNNLSAEKVEELLNAFGQEHSL